MGSWLIEKGVAFLVRILVVAGGFGMAWGMLKYQVSDAVNLGKDNRDDIQRLWSAKAATDSALSQTLQEMQRSLGRIEGALGTK